MRHNIRSNNKTMFELKNFTSHSGLKLDWKIDCDALRLKDWEALANIISKQFKFKTVVGVPTGGLLLQSYLRKYQDKTSDITLIVDDVCTTGHSLEQEKAKHSGKVQGVVIFNRGNCPKWVVPLFDLNKRFKHGINWGGNDEYLDACSSSN